MSNIDNIDAAVLGPPRQSLWDHLKPIFTTAVVCFGLFFLLTILAQPYLDYPIVRYLNSFAARNLLFDFIMSALTKLHLFKGVVLVAGLVWVWFETQSLRDRAKLAAGVLGASFAGLTSRGLEILLPTHFIPLHTEALHFVQPYMVEAHHGHTFPSDHCSLLFGLAMTIYLVRPRLGIIAFGWAALVGLSRIYSGIHFPTDVLGAASLGIAVACIFQHPRIRHFCESVLQWPLWTEKRGLFYALAFVAAYCVSTLFDDVRAVGKGLDNYHHGNVFESFSDEKLVDHRGNAPR